VDSRIQVIMLLFCLLQTWFCHLK